MRSKWKSGAILAAVAVAGLAVVGGASAATSAPSPGNVSGGCTALTVDPKALAEMQALRTEKQTAWQAWFEKYGDDRRSAEAQAAKETLRDQYRSDMTDLLEKYGVEVPEGAGPGSRAGQGGHGYGKGGGMMGGGHGMGQSGSPGTTTSI